MASPPQAEAHSPSSDLHTHSLSFPLDALDALSSTQLALVQFHPRADDTQMARARALFVQRRMAWLEEEMARATAREQATAAAAAAVAQREGDRSRLPLSRVKEEQDEGLVELQPEAGPSVSMATSRPPASSESPVGSVKREGENEEREVRLRQLDAPRLLARALSPSATPTPAPTTAAASAPARVVDRPARGAPSTTSATVDPRRRPRPPAPAPPARPAPEPARIVKREVEEISLLDDDDDDDDEPESRPFTLPRASGSSAAQVMSPSASPRLSPSTKRPSAAAAAAAGGARPSKAPRRALSAASPPVAPTAERLKGMPSFRRNRQASPPAIQLSTRGGLVPTPTPTPPPAPVTLLPKPNPLAHSTSSTAPPLFPASTSSSSRTPLPRGIQAALRAGRAPSLSDWEFEHWVQPPSPFPTFVALGAPAVDQGAGDPIAPALARRLYTVRVHGLSDDCTAALLFFFFARNQGRLRPRPLAIRATDEPPPYLDGLHQPRQPVFFFAFGSLEAAELIVKDNDRRLLPDMDDHEPRQISIELVRDAVPVDATWDARRASEAKELEVDWRWGELSDEARWYWTRRADLPPSPVCPRFEDVEIEGRPISDEYSAEVDRIAAKATGEPGPSARDELMAFKKRLYNSRRNKWRSWLSLGPAQQAAVRARGEDPPLWPVWPMDDDAFFTMPVSLEVDSAAVAEVDEAALGGAGLSASWSSASTSTRC